MLLKTVVEVPDRLAVPVDAAEVASLGHHRAVMGGTDVVAAVRRDVQALVDALPIARQGTRPIAARTSM